MLRTFFTDHHTRSAIDPRTLNAPERIVTPGAADLEDFAICSMKF